jgi:hypothetical protein
MKRSKKSTQLSLFNDLPSVEVVSKSRTLSLRSVSESTNSEGKVVSLMEYKYKKAEEKFKSYSSHLL